MPAQATNVASRPPPVQPTHVHRSMDGQVKAIGAVQIVFGALALVGALFILLSGGYAAKVIEEEGEEPAVADFVRSLMGVLGFVLFVYAALGIVGAIGLFQLKGWGRGLSLAFCGISLVNIPFGTALGIWGLVVLTRPETADLVQTGPGALA